MKRYMLYTLGLLLSVMMYSCEKDEPLQIHAKTDLSGTVWEGTYTVPTYRGTWKVFVHFVTVDSVHMKFYSIRQSEENEDTSRFPLSLYGFRSQGKGHYAVEKNVLSFQLDTYDEHGDIVKAGRTDFMFEYTYDQDKLAEKTFFPRHTLRDLTYFGKRNCAAFFGLPEENSFTHAVASIKLPAPDDEGDEENADDSESVT